MQQGAKTVMENILYTGKKLTARTRMEPARWTLDRETHRTPSIYLRLLDSIRKVEWVYLSILL